ncbi:MAG: flagellar hook-associated protein FlgK [Deltaproteobacteria bacterium]|jgi:flagellar hook-associated protein 1 FlgK|nr:flagellar hook-associated protein FlgK [Deltaproteobacteria bacterium]
MTDINAMMSLAGQALLTQQQAISVTSHNIANVNTPGYSRQQLIMTANTPVDSSIGPMGSGVSAESIERVYDRYLNAQISNESQGLGRWDAQKDAVKLVEMIFNEANGSGLNEAMSKFWNAWQSLTSDPDGTTERQVLITASQILATTFRQLDTDLSQSQQDLDFVVEGTVTDINRLAQQLADLNEKILSSEVGSMSANDYRDKRELLLKELSELIDIDSFEDASGTLSVSAANGWPLVTADQYWQLSTETNVAGLQEVVWVDDEGNTTNINAQISGGKLRGLIEVRDTIINDYMTRLDSLAGTLMNDVNVLHQAGFDLNGIGGEVFFIGSGTASDLEVNSNIVADLNLIAAASDAATVPGDGRNAVEIANLQYELNMGGNKSYNDYYGVIVRDVGNEVLKSNAYYNHQSDMMVQLENQRESVSGVSLDEEMINLIKFQNAYTAAAKLITTADEMMQTVLQMI